MRRPLIAAAGVLVVVLIASQLLLPGIAASKLRSDLEAHGSNVKVEVKAFPALKLLFKHADRVTVDVTDYTSGGEGERTSLPELLARTKAVGKLDAHVRVLEDRLLRMQDVRLRKDGDTLVADVALRTADVDAALPARLQVTGGADDDGLSVAGVTSVFGSEIHAQAKIVVDDKGRIVLHPEGIPFASLVTVPIFSDERIAVEAIGARPTADGFAVTARGHLNG